MTLETKKTQTGRPVVLAFYLNSKGIAYGFVDSPSLGIESGYKTYKPISSRRCLRQAQVYLEYFKPDIVLLEDTESHVSYKRNRIKNLIEDIAIAAENQHLKVTRYTREDIRKEFEPFSAITKYEIAKQIASWHSEYEDRLPKIRKLYTSESYSMAEFDALSLAYTHYYRT